MIAVIFEFTPVEGRFADYRALAEGLADDVRNADGFLSIERFESITSKGKFVSLQYWRDEECVRKWRTLQKHREAQKKGRAGIFKSYRLRGPNCGATFLKAASRAALPRAGRG